MIRNLHLVRTPIYRCVPSLEDGLIHAPEGNRIPKHVPVLVDNIWEYLRPVEMPSRRSSAFGSPTPLLASRFGPPDGVVGRVFVTRPCTIAQISRCPDASLHEDIESIPVMLRNTGIADVLLRQLSSTLLQQAQIGVLIRAAGLPALIFAKASTFWQQCTLLEPGIDDVIDITGEMFFEAPRGYALRPS
jgi:hypothetical protein